MRSVSILHFCQKPERGHFQLSTPNSLNWHHAFCNMFHLCVQHHMNRRAAELSTSCLWIFGTTESCNLSILLNNGPCFFIQSSIGTKYLFTSLITSSLNFRMTLWEQHSAIQCHLPQLVGCYSLVTETARAEQSAALWNYFLLHNSDHWSWDACNMRLISILLVFKRHFHEAVYWIIESPVSIAKNLRDDIRDSERNSSSMNGCNCWILIDPRKREVL